MQAVEEVVVTCRCGNQMQQIVEGMPKGEPFILVCRRCALNHRFEWRNSHPVLVMRYYFPDD